MLLSQYTKTSLYFLKQLTQGVSIRVNKLNYDTVLCIVCRDLQQQQQQQQQQQPFYGPLSGTTQMSRYQKKHWPTHHPDHPIFISFFHLLRSIASSLFKLRVWQSFCTTSFHVFFGLPLGLEPSTSYSINPISVFFSQHMPIPLQPVLL